MTSDTAPHSVRRRYVFAKGVTFCCKFSNFFIGFFRGPPPPDLPQTWRKSPATPLAGRKRREKGLHLGGFFIIFQIKLTNSNLKFPSHSGTESNQIPFKFKLALGSSPGRHRKRDGGTDNSSCRSPMHANFAGIVRGCNCPTSTRDFRGAKNTSASATS